MSLFVQVTVPPISPTNGIYAVLGMKQFGSHPGVDEPGAFVTVTAFSITSKVIETV